MVQILGLPLLACLLMVAILGAFGIHVLKREVIFVDISLAQVAAVGAIVAHLVFHAHGDSVLGYVSAMTCVLGAALFYAFVRRRVAQISLEAVIGVSYAIAAAAALFLFGVAPGHKHDVHQMLAGNLLLAGWSEIGLCALVCLGAGAGLFLLRAPFRRISDNYGQALAHGARVVWWDFLFYALLGLVITLAVRLAGVVVVFAMLIIPATTSALFSSRWGPRLAVTWGVGAIASMAGLLFAYQLDFSLGPSVALLLGAVLVLSALYRACTGGLHRGSKWMRMGPREPPERLGAIHRGNPG